MFWFDLGFWLNWVIFWGINLISGGLWYNYERLGGKSFKKCGVIGWIGVSLRYLFLS